MEAFQCKKYSLILNENLEDIAGLQSVAAVLGAISFGVFIGLMACSVLYKRWSRNRSHVNQQTVEEGNDDDGCEDAIQREAPPSYDKGILNFFSDRTIG